MRADGSQGLDAIRRRFEAKLSMMLQQHRYSCAEGVLLEGDEKEHRFVIHKAEALLAKTSRRAMSLLDALLSPRFDGPTTQQVRTVQSHAYVYSPRWKQLVWVCGRGRACTRRW